MTDKRTDSFAAGHTEIISIPQLDETFRCRGCRYAKRDHMLGPTSIRRADSPDNRQRGVCFGEYGERRQDFQCGAHLGTSHSHLLENHSEHCASSERATNVGLRTIRKPYFFALVHETFHPDHDDRSAALNVPVPVVPYWKDYNYYREY